MGFDACEIALGAISEVCPAATVLQAPFAMGRVPVDPATWALPVPHGTGPGPRNASASGR
jgi:hypothetical protein